MLCWLVLWAGPLSVAAAERPEINRATAAPQAVGASHTLRAIPEACVRIEGRFTGDAAAPYRFATVPTGPGCRPRAQLLDAAGARPSPDAGWILNDVVRVPSAGCPTLMAVARIWRRPGRAVPPAPDPQGRVRVYLEDAMKAAPASAQRPAYVAVTGVEGRACDVRR